MYWVEIEADGRYIYDGQEYPIPVDDVQEFESYESERFGNDWAKIVIPFLLETEHGNFKWEIEVIEYLKLNVTSFLGFSLKELPSEIILKEEVVFRLQDGWLSSDSMRIEQCRFKCAPGKLKGRVLISSQVC
ncbi:MULTISPECIES: hypothetical protein [Pseudomonas]|uniref:hypothetical protein n=1 Tax=Pseudomonas TaxID=286 RepID=UPI001FF2991F|nr:MULTISPECIES: hypothetical protein [Pseudomonas]